MDNNYNNANLPYYIILPPSEIAISDYYMN